jgi:hypothetical protein
VISTTSERGTAVEVPGDSNLNVRAKSGLPIRLTDERWSHIIEEHGELSELREEVLRTISDPERILAGDKGALLTLRTLEPGKWLVVIYRELEEDGFVITAFLTRRFRSLERRTQLWP